MKRKSIIALAFAMALAGAASTTITAEASSLNQASNPSQVKYGVVNEEFKAILKKYFDANYYAENNQDVTDVLGTNPEDLFVHFIKYGIWEGRKGWPDFDPIAYASAYPDLLEAYGYDILSYYVHYINFGQTEGRTLTTVEDCIENGITIVPFFSNYKVVDASYYYASELLETTDYETVQEAVEITDYETVQEAVETASAQGGSVVVNNPETGESYVIAPSNVSLPEGYEKLGTLKTNDGVYICVLKAPAGYVIKTDDGNSTSEDEDIDNMVAVLVIEVFSPDYFNEIANNSSDPDYSVTGVPEQGNMVVDRGVQIADSSNIEGDITTSDGSTGTNESVLQVTQDGEEYEFNIGVDENGTEDSTYDYGTVVEDNGDGTVSVTVVVTDQDTEMVHEDTFTFHDGENE